MVSKIELIKDELQTATDLPKVFRLEDEVDKLIDKLYDSVDMAVINAESALLGVRALRRRIFFENPDGTYATDEPNQSLTEAGE